MLMLWLVLQVPADRVADWKHAGLPSGLASRKAVIEVKADPTGAADAAPAIQAAIDAARPEEVVFLPAGTYKLSRGIGVKSRVTLRGAGPEKTVLKGPVSIGAGGADWWYPNRTRVDVLGKRGSGTLACPDTSKLNVGDVCQLFRKNDRELPVIAPGGGFDFLQRQVTRVTAKTPTSVTVAPAPLFDLPEGSRLAAGGRFAEGAGVEDLGIDGRGLNLQVGLSVTGAFACWVRNVSVRYITNYNVSVSDSLSCEIKHCTIGSRQGAGSNGAGILFGTSTACKVEDNILLEQFPHLEVNAACGNVFAYNYCHDSDIQGVVGCSINSNHGAHSCFNLYEGNVSPKFQADGYHGSSSHDTLLRNRLHGTSAKTDQFWICVNLNRFTRHYTLLGNVLGAPGHSWVYDNKENGYGYDQHLIYSFGLPNMGNGGFSGKASRNSWKDWGKSPGPGGFQELDLDVRATAILRWNFNYKDKSVPGSEMSGSCPKSLYLKEKPEWFGTGAWPPYGPDASFEANKIPAQLRFEKKGT
jgi:hypothetical protein